MKEKKNRVITIKIDKELLEELDLWAINRKMSRSEAVRLAILLLLSSKNNTREL